jgi:CDP-4-dehydro-6-deoxyglucose reductase
MLAPWITGKVIQITDETSTTRRFWIEIPELTVFDFKPGQFITVDLPIHEKANKRLRSYSIASWPNGSNVFELIIVRLEDGVGSTYLFNEIKVGSELKLRGPQGVFVLPPVLDKDLYLICTGTGVAPFRSMIHWIKDQKISHKKIHLIFGCRTKANLLYYEEMKALENELEGFSYHPILSREKWEGKTGYVHSIYLDLCKKASDESEPASAYFLLCGWRPMIDEAKRNLLELGYDKKTIHVELYG